MCLRFIRVQRGFGSSVKTEDQLVSLFYLSGAACSYVTSRLHGSESILRSVTVCVEMYKFSPSSTPCGFPTTIMCKNFS